VLIWFAQEVGLEVILGAFVAGAVLRLVGRRTMTHPVFHIKLDALGYGMFIPIFFITSGVRFDIAALTSSPSALGTIPLFVVALLAVRGLPALLYRRRIGRRLTLVAALLQATSLPFIVAAAEIGMELGLLSTEVGASVIAAGLVSMLAFPLATATLLSDGPSLSAMSGRGAAGVAVARRGS
jgi:Kef-type K+ transport system membrane component KefB